MTLTRILLKLEVKNDCKVIDFSYTAPDLEEEFQKFEYISGKSRRGRPAKTLATLSSQQEIDTFLGQRKYQTYTIQTYLNDMATRDEKKNKISSQKLEKTTAKNVGIDEKKNDAIENKHSSTKEKEKNMAADVSVPKTKSNKHEDVEMEAKEAGMGVANIPAMNSTKKGGVKPQERSQPDHPTKASFKSALVAVSREGSTYNDTQAPFDSSAFQTTKPHSDGGSIDFFSGNPAVESAEGVMHLYKENQVHSEQLPPTHMVSMLCVPATVRLQDLLSFLKPVSQDLELIKIVKSSAPNEYMALLKFRSMNQAHEFYKAYNSRAYNCIEADICHLVFVAHVECGKSQEGAGKPFPNAVELPVCAVCLEKMDESIEGILTILCNHSFHAPCMAKCEDFVCPVCRYVQTPVPVAGNKCFQCSIHEDLWICLICGEVGCGRYTNGHAYNHFKDTAHTFAMQLGSNRVWDYVGENYVHRLVMNKMDGKVVEVERGRWMDGGAPMMQDEKCESLSLEYTYLLTNQLESQREYFENKIKIIESAKEKEVEELSISLREAVQARESDRLAVVAFTKDKHVLEKRCALLSTKLTKLQSSLDEEREMSRCLRQNQQEWQTKVNQLEERLTLKENESVELRDQLRDIMFYLGAQNKLASTAADSDVTQEELQEGHVVVPPPPPPPEAPSKSSKRSGRRKK